MAVFARSWSPTGARSRSASCARCASSASRSVAVYSEADRDAPARRVRRRGVPDRARRPPPRATSRSSACSRRRPAPAPRRSTRATASWPRTPASRGPVEDAGLIWIGPPPDAIELMGEKTRARGRWRRPACRSSRARPSRSTRSRACCELGERIGYPLLIKAAAGGGGKGHKVVARARRGRARHSSPRSARAQSYFADSRSTSSAISRIRATSRCRCSRTRTATSSTSASATARSSGVTRSSSRRRRRRPSTPRCARASAQIGVDAARAAGYRSRRHDRGPADRRRRRTSSWR